ncbi:MAG: hypothetical protein HY055_09780 [Magnetospirillum sp.]|nr:hypothetical protein [Magnetospirillum sp.]
MLNDAGAQRLYDRLQAALILVDPNGKPVIEQTLTVGLLRDFANSIPLGIDQVVKKDLFRLHVPGIFSRWKFFVVNSIPTPKGQESALWGMAIFLGSYVAIKKSKELTHMHKVAKLIHSALANTPVSLDGQTPAVIAPPPTNVDWLEYWNQLAAGAGSVT